MFGSQQSEPIQKNILPESTASVSDFKMPKQPRRMPKAKANPPSKRNEWFATLQVQQRPDMPPPDALIRSATLAPPKSVLSGSMSLSGLSASQSGQHSPTNSVISVATSVMSTDCKAIFDERLRQVQSAVTKLR